MSDYSTTFNAPVSSSGGTQVWYIDPWLTTCRIRVWGAGGGGEKVGLDAALTTTAGGNGGSSSVFGVAAGGGYGGGRNTNGTIVKGAGGNGGSTSLSNSPDWNNLGVSITRIDGTNGSFNSGGSVDTTTAYINSVGKGGDGSVGERIYTSFSEHIFDNEADETLYDFTNISTDISINYVNPEAEGINGDRPLGGKHYIVTFNDAFVDDTWTYSLTNSQMAAGGGTGGVPYTHTNANTIGYRDKTANGFKIWFQTGGGGNTYIRNFEIIARGVKAAARGKGGGGGSFVEFELTRQNLIDAGYNMNPYDEDGIQSNSGDPLTYYVGNAGSSSETNGTGSSGLVTIHWYEIPQVYLTTNRSTITRGGSAILTWNTYGDADSFSFTAGGVDNENLNSFTPETVSPIITTTYTGTATGIGGTSYNSESSVTIYVWQIPTIDTFTVPENVDYGTSTISVGYDSSYCDISLKIKIKYSFDEGPQKNDGMIEGDTIEITVDDVTPFAEDTETNSVSGTVDINLPWFEWGPSLFSISIEADGSGGSVNTFEDMTVTIDKQPDNLDIDGRGTKPDDLIIDEVAISPSVEVYDEGFQITDIDIPVEVKSNYPIEVTINDIDNWQKVRQL
jgi:hypothetical protein